MDYPSIYQTHNLVIANVNGATGTQFTVDSVFPLDGLIIFWSPAAVINLSWVLHTLRKICSRNDKKKKEKKSKKKKEKKEEKRIFYKNIRK